MEMFNPPHPGGTIKRNIVDALNMDITTFASRLGMSRVAMSRVLNGRASISPDLAIRLEMAGFSNAAFWLRLQTAYDLSQARRNPQPVITPFKPLEAASDQAEARS